MSELVLKRGERQTLFLTHEGATAESRRIVLSAGAELELAQLLTEGTPMVELEIELTEGASCRLTTVAAAGATAVVRVVLKGREASFEMASLALVGGSEHAVVRVHVRHDAAGCVSRTLSKTVAWDDAVSTFEGLVYVARDAQRTDARQQSRGLLLSPRARIEAEPQLEIYADDVRCSHGATVGQLSGDAILYMRQRGLTERAARRLQLEGFMSEVTAHCTDEKTRQALDAAVSVKLQDV